VRKLIATLGCAASLLSISYPIYSEPATLTPGTAQDSSQSAEAYLKQAALAISQQQPEQALAILGNIQNVSSLPGDQQINYYHLLAATDTAMDNPIGAAQDLMNLDPLLSDDAQVQNRQAIWQNLQQASIADLDGQLRYVTNPIQHGWLQLAYIEKADEYNVSQLNTELASWQAQFPNHPASYLLPASLAHAPTATPSVATQPQNTVTDIAVLIPESGNLSFAGDAVRSGIMAAVNAQKASTPIPMQFYNTADGKVASLYQQAITQGANWIIGPLNKDDVNSLAQQPNLTVPTLALNFTSDETNTKGLYQFALSPLDEAVQVADKAHADGYTHAIIIAPTGSWGHGVANAFNARWQVDGGMVVDNFYYTNQASLDPGIKNLLQLSKPAADAKPDDANAQPTHRSDVDMIFLVADPENARQIKPLLNFYYASDIPVYAISMVYSGLPSANDDKDLDGIRFCDIPFVLQSTPVINQAKQQMQQALPNLQPQMVRLFAFGYDAYHLLNYLPQLGTSPADGYQGLTGTLYLSNNQQIMRELAWAQFQGGVPVAL
jgi:hypothetical protein